MTENSRPATITEFVTFAHGGAFARPLQPAIKEILMACDPFSDRGKTLQFTDQHRATLYRARFLLDPAENTAPALDPARPFGTPNPLGDVGDATGERTWEGVARLYCEAQAAIPLLFQHGDLAPGRYTISNLSMRELAWITDNPAKTLDVKLREIGIGSSRKFEFTLHHLALLRSANWRWDAWDDHIADEAKIWPVVFVDAKRTYSVNALQENFGWESNLDRHGHHQMTDEQRNLLWKTHKQILPAFQVFVENAELAPGLYAVK